MASMGLEAVLTMAIMAEMIPKKIPPHTFYETEIRNKEIRNKKKERTNKKIHTVAMVAMYSS